MIGDFLSRWSRRKQAAAKTADPAQAPPPAESSSEPAGSGEPEPRQPQKAPDPGAPAFDPASLPPIESITAETDIRAFIAAGVPAELTRAALRRVWTSDPKIRDFVGLADYDWDFNAPGAMAGFGPLEGADVLRAQAAHRLGPVTAEDSAAERSDHAPGAEPAAPKSEACAHDRSDPPTPIKTEDESLLQIDASHLPDQLARPDSDHAATQQQEEKPEEAPSSARRKHGRALPE
jgi:hypothetical protein